MVRARVQPLLMHLHARNVPALYASTVRRFVAGDDIALDDLHMALWGIETAAYFASDEALSKVAREAASYYLPMCSAGYQERLRQAFTNLMREMDNGRGAWGLSASE